MKIAVPTSQFMPVISGITNLVLDLSEILADRYGHEFTVITQKYAITKACEVYKGVKIKRYSYIRLLRGYEISPGIIKGTLDESPDIIHSFHYGYFPVYAGMVASRICKKPHITTPVLHPPIFGPYRSALFYGYHFLQGLPVLRNADFITALSYHETDLIQKLGGERKKIKVIYNPVNTKKFRPTKNRSSGVKDKVVLFVAPLNRSKGADVAFEIAKQILRERDDTTFVFKGQGIFEKKFKAEAKKFGPKDFVFVKKIPQTELIDWLNTADVLFLPTAYEAFGRVLAEAESCGKPVVATNVGAVNEVVVNNKTGFIVDYGNWNFMKEKINMLLDNERLARAMGHKARKHVIEKFEIGKIAKQYNRLYTQA